MGGGLIMARKRIPKGRLGAATKHSLARILRHCGFNGSEWDAKDLLARCRRLAGRNGEIVIRAKDLGIPRSKMHGMPNGKFSVAFLKGKAPTVLPLGLP